MAKRILDFEFGLTIGEQPERFYMTLEVAGNHTEVYAVHSTTEEGDVMLEMECGYFDEIYDHAISLYENNKKEVVA